MTLDLRLGDSLNTEFPHADLVLTDPPWKYQQRFGATSAEDHYEGMEYEQIIDLLFERMSWSRLCMWITAPHLGSFLRRYFLTEAVAHKNTLGPTTAGAWDKGPRKYGQGYHIAGRTEFWLMWTRGKTYTSRQVLADNGAQWDPNGFPHSFKPVRYQSKLVAKWVPPGGLVVDPFLGRGSVALATQESNVKDVRFIGVEKSRERWVDACNRTGWRP